MDLNERARHIVRRGFSKEWNQESTYEAVEARIDKTIHSMTPLELMELIFTTIEDNQAEEEGH